MPQEPTAFKNFAFISYSRKDSKAAGWVQKRLEWFRFPVKLVPEDRRPTNARYIRPVYRDKTNLEVTDEHYWTNIRRALEQSRHLIVLCSPHSAVSEPVNMEVAHFLESHGGDISLVAPVILGGNVTSTTEDAALCPALLALGDTLINRNLPTMVPDAVTTEQDAWEQGFVSLVSYLLRLERTALGDHIRHEERRQSARNRALAAVFALLALIAAAGGVSAWHQRRAALDAKHEIGQANAVIVGQNREIAEKNDINLKNLHEASMADYAVAVQRLEKDGKWHEGVAHLARALKWEPGNSLAASRLYSLLSLEAPAKQTWPRHVLRHEGKVNGARFSPDGSHVVTTSVDGSARVWSTSTGKAQGDLLRHKMVVRSAEFSPDGQQVVTASDDGCARIWDTITGKPVGKPLLHDDSVLSADFSPDGTRIVTAGADYCARIWDSATGKPMVEPLRHAHYVWSAQFSPDGTRIVTASEDGTARVWDTEGKQVGGPWRHEAGVRSARFSPDGQHVITISADKFSKGSYRNLWVWALPGSKPAAPLWHKQGVANLDFSPDDELFVTSTGDNQMIGGEAQIWTGKPEPLGESLKHEAGVSSARFSPDGLHVITSGRDGGARVWETYTGKPTGEPLRHSEGVVSAEFSPDGRHILTVSADGIAWVWDATAPKPQGEPLRHNRSVSSAKFSSDGQRVLTASSDMTARLWDASAGKPIGEPLRHDDDGYDMWGAEFSPDNRQILTVTIDIVARKSVARVWSADTGRLTGKPMRLDEMVVSGQFSPDGQRILTAGRGPCALAWEVATGDLVTPRYWHGGKLWCARFSANGGLIVTAGDDWVAQIWDTLAGNTLNMPLTHEGVVRHGEFSPDGLLIVTASEDKTARVWDAATGKLMGGPLRHDDKVWHAQFSPDGQRILTVGADMTARIWEAASGRSLGVPMRHESKVLSARFSPDGRHVVTASADATARLWETAAGKQTGTSLRHTHDVQDVQFSSDGCRLVSASADGTARLWDVSSFTHPPVPVPDWMLERALAVAGLMFAPDGTLISIPQEQRTASILPPPYGSSGWAKLARWLAQPANERTLTPDSKFTCRQISERERDSGSKDGIESALRYDPTVPLAHVLLAKFEEDPRQADFLRGFGLELLPDDAGLWARAAASLVEQKDLKRALQAADKALMLEPNNTDAQKARTAAVEILNGM